VLGDQPLIIMGASAGVNEITLANDERAFAIVHTLAGNRGQSRVPDPRRRTGVLALRHHADRDAVATTALYC